MSIPLDEGKKRMADNSEKKATRYYIDADETDGYGKAIKPMIVSRMGYAVRQSLTADVVEEMQVEDLIQQVADQVVDNQDFLLPDTPLKEAIFRVVLANENKPMTAEEVSKVLEGKWSLSPYPRDISPQVIERLLANAFEMYRIAAILPEPEEDQDEEDEGTETAGDVELQEEA